MGAFYEFDDVDTFTAAAIGQPGSRVFYLHARAGNQRVTVRCEKQQVGAIAQYLRRVLSDLPPPEDRPMPDAVDLSGAAEQETFVLGPIGLGYDRGNDRVLVQLEELVPADFSGDEDEDRPVVDEVLDDLDRGKVRLYVTRGQAAAFCELADHLVAAGRPTCAWCGNPIDPDGHPCPRMN
jgi:uncharacterized repeat protein (TIGR03847 family)